MTDGIMLSLPNALHLVMLGLSLYLAVRHAVLLHDPRQHRAHLAVAAFFLTTTVYLVLRGLASNAPPEDAAVFNRGYVAVGLGFPAIMLWFCGGVSGISPLTPVGWSLLAADALSAVVTLATNLMLTPDAFMSHDAMGTPMAMPVTGPLLWVTIPVILANVAYGIVLLRRGPPLDKVEVRIIQVTVVVAMVLTNLDVVRVMLHLTPWRLPGLSPVLGGLGMSLILSHRWQLWSRSLEQQIQARTEMLQDANSALEEALFTASDVRDGLERLIASSPDAIVTAAQGLVTDVNAAALTMLKAQDRSELVGLPIEQIFQSADAEQPGASAAKETLFTRRDGTTGHADITQLQGVLSGVQVTMRLCRDTTERREMQQRLVMMDRLASLGTLAAGVAHEINNPLAFIKTNVELIQEALQQAAAGKVVLDSARLAELLEMASDAAEGSSRIRAIVRDLRALGQPEETPRGPVDVHATLRTAVKMTDLAVKFRATVVLDLEPVPRVQGQDTQLGQVFMNLIMNAAQAMPAGQKDHNTITLHARTVQGAVEVVIEDTGCGIPPHLLDRVFDPFFTTKTGGEGMGLGLAICHRIVVDMGGHISVESSMGKGTRVIVRLPGLAVEEAAPAPCALPETSLKARNVWVVDDETLVGRALQRLLKGHQVTVFTRAEEALDHVQDSPRPDLILCDVTMPQMDGPQFFSALKQSRPSLCDCVVFMSGGVDSLQTRAVLKETGRPFLEKPLETARLLSVLDSVAHAA